MDRSKLARLLLASAAAAAVLLAAWGLQVWRNRAPEAPTPARSEAQEKTSAQPAQAVAEPKKPAAPVDLEQEALRLALVLYFGRDGWQGKPCYLKKSAFTDAEEYPLNDWQPPAKVIDLAALKELAQGEPLSPYWTTVNIVRRPMKGKDVITVMLFTCREKLDPSFKGRPLGAGLDYYFEVQGDALTLLGTAFMAT